MDIQRNPDTPYMRARQIVMEILNSRIFKVWLQPDFLFNLTPYSKQQKVNIDLTHKFTDKIVSKKLLEYKKNKETGRVQSEGQVRSVLEMLFQRDFTDKQLRGQVDSITVAGNDTTALVISYTLVLLGIHQDVQQKVLEEQGKIFNTSMTGAIKEDIQDMHFLERVIKESMRLYTVAPIIARNVDRSLYLRNDTSWNQAVVGSFAIHRSEAIWGKNANEFDPDRFLPDRSVVRHPSSFTPFRYGPRNCIGRNFGMFIMKSVLSSIIRRYKIEAEEIGPLRMEMLLFPVNGHQIKIIKKSSFK